MTTRCQLDSESELLSNLLAREPSAWQEFSRRYDRLIYRCIHRVTGRFGSIVSSDGVREIYSALMLSLLMNDMRKLRSFAPERGNKLSTWVALLATNAAWDHLRALARQQPQNTVPVFAECAMAPTDPHDAYEEKEGWHRMNALLASFSGKDRDFVKLYYVEGYSPEVVAKKMGISVKTVYSKKHKIRSRLEKLVEFEQAETGHAMDAGDAATQMVA